MKGFKKLALTAAICSAPMAASALEVMDDSLLSAVTGQEGITMTIAPNNLSLDILVEDDDGYTDDIGLGAGTIPVTWDEDVLITPLVDPTYAVLTSENYNNTTTAESGAIAITGMKVNVANAGDVIEAKIDVGYDGVNNGARLVVGITLPAGMTVEPGEIGVVGTNGQGNTIGTAQGTPTNPVNTPRASLNDSSYGKIVSIGAIGMGDTATSLTMVMGNGDDLVTMYGSVNPTITALQLDDPSTSNAGSLGMASMSITGLVLDGTTVNIHDTAGLQITMGAGLNNIGMSIDNMYAGPSATIGDIYISGLNMAGTTIAIKGH